MNEQNIIGKIVNDYYELTRIMMGTSSSYEYLTTMSFSIANMIRLLDKEVGDELLADIGDEIAARNNLMRNTRVSKGDNPFDEVSRKTDFISGIDNDLKMSICEEIGNVLSENDIF